MNDTVAAMQELSRKQTPSLENYIREIQTAYASGNRVILTKTREPIRLIESLTDYCKESDNTWKHWDSMRGWTSYADTGDGETYEATTDKMDNFQAALEVIHARVPAVKQVNPAGYEEVFPDNGIYFMMYPHATIEEGSNKNHKSIQCLKHYVAELPYKEKMVILCVPEAFKCPIELEDDVAMIDFNLPSVMERFEIILDTLADIYGDQFEEDKGGDVISEFEHWSSVLNASSGLTLKNFQDYLTSALLSEAPDDDDLSAMDIEAIANHVNKAKTEIIKRSDILEIMEGESMRNVGGQDLLKEWIGNRSNAFTQQARDYGVDAPKGVMMVGPPGTGKSVSAKAIANTLGIPLIRFDVSRVFNSLVGSSEARIRNALKLVDALEPCVLFIDEVDKVFNQGSGGNDSGVSSRVLGTLLTWMQETESKVFIVMTANRTLGLPPEMLRKGRMDEIFSVTTPSAEEIKQIVEIHMRKRGHDSDGLDMDAICKEADGYVPSEIECAVKEAILAAFNHNLENPKKKVDVTAEMIIAELKNMTPLSVSFAEDFEEMEKWASNNARPASSNPRKVTSSKTTTVKKRRRKVSKVNETEDGTLDISSH